MNTVQKCDSYISYKFYTVVPLAVNGRKIKRYIHLHV
jgi:hypothetical protein